MAAQNEPVIDPEQIFRSARRIQVFLDPETGGISPEYSEHLQSNLK